MMSLSDVLVKLRAGLNEYEKVVNQQIVYVYYRNGSYKELEFQPTKSNFMHLCGIDYQDVKSSRKMSPIQFYEALKKNKISANGITRKPFTDQKLQILSCLTDLTRCSISILDGQVTFLNLSFDKAIRSKKQLFCLALIRKQDNTYVPNSLLNLRTDKTQSIGKGFPVHQIYKINKETNEKEVICQTDDYDKVRYT